MGEPMLTTAGGSGFARNPGLLRTRRAAPGIRCAGPRTTYRAKAHRTRPSPARFEDSIVRTRIAFVLSLLAFRSVNAEEPAKKWTLQPAWKPVAGTKLKETREDT